MTAAGARVIRVERVDGGDFARAHDTGVRGARRWAAIAALRSAGAVA